jgi:lipopolysaccharide/colanic/teichoic acid biosynthesis glycosyltransferase
MITRHPPKKTLERPTVWGLKPVQINDRFWAAKGVQVVRQGERVDLAEGPELFLLTTPGLLLLFKLAPVVRTMSWLKPRFLSIRLYAVRERPYRELAVADSHQRFVRYQRIYGGPQRRKFRVVLTPDRALAELWQSAPGSGEAWRRLREEVPASSRASASITGRAYDSSVDSDAMECIRELIRTWKRPDATVKGVQRLQGNVWAYKESRVHPQAHFIGPVWIGAGRGVDRRANVVGPAVLWDKPGARPPPAALDWKEIEPTSRVRFPSLRRRPTRLSRWGKRGFDLLVALAALTVALPLFPLILLAIWIEDGPPFFFAHRRETLGGRTFPCLKFRSMRRDAEKVKAELAKNNQADGPQFFMQNDPRLTRVGRFLRASKLDELPQLLNVLLGHMSLVGPRPSPFEENQYCPAWREARLSVPPGITGLWQVKRTRRKGLDFQEWIKYDLEYVEKASFSLDLWILAMTAVRLVRGRF